MTRTTIMLSEEIKRRAVAEARRLKVSFADFVRQAVSEKLPEHRKGSDRLARRRRDPIFGPFASLPAVTRKTPGDVSSEHDKYLYGKNSDFGES